MIYKLIDLLRHRGRLRRWDPDLAQGRRGEDLAHRYLRSRGFTIVARNYRPRSSRGEIDVIAWDGSVLVFVEVKSRANTDFGTPDEAVDHDKQTHLIRAAQAYLARTGTRWTSVRFDIVSVVFGQPPLVTHITDAFAKNEFQPTGSL
jgi:putative endonuclease